jgi:hypothetical protein
MSEIWGLYRHHPSFILGFHGCDRSIGEDVLSGQQTLLKSQNDYDWLGEGIYFWENNPTRALDFATKASQGAKKTTRGKIVDPFIIGAVIDLGRCANLLDSAALDEVKTAHQKLEAASIGSGVPLPINVGGADKRVRRLDCAVIEAMHELRRGESLKEYQTVRAIFQEGGELYGSAGFCAKTHIQIAVRDSSCIKGFFRPIHATASVLPKPLRKQIAPTAASKRLYRLR